MLATAYPKFESLDCTPEEYTARTRQRATDAAFIAAAKRRRRQLDVSPASQTELERRRRARDDQEHAVWLASGDPDADRATAELEMESIKKAHRAICMAADSTDEEVEAADARFESDLADWHARHDQLWPLQKAKTMAATIYTLPTSSTPAISATPFQWIDPAAIPERQWLYGHALIRGHVTVTVAPPGTGKSSKEIVDALAITSGQMLLHDRPYGTIRVWLWNGEDPMDELQRRITAAAVRHKLRPENFVPRLFVDSGRSMEIKVARMEGSGTTIAEPVLHAVIDTIRRNQIDVVSIDPFVSSHSVSENDNNAIDVVTKLWAKIADVTGCAVHLIHHPRKTGGASVEAEDARGAGALIATARVVRTLNVMSSDEATKAGVDNRTAHVRVDDAKANLAPRSDVAKWLKIENIPLGNGGVMGGDKVGVVVRWQWPNAMDGITPADLTKAQAAVAAGQWRENIQAKDWVGKPIAEALGLDIAKADDKAKVRGLVRHWITSGALAVVTGHDDKRNERPFVEVGVGQLPGRMLSPNSVISPPPPRCLT